MMLIWFLGAMYIFNYHHNNNVTKLRANVLDCLGRAVVGLEVAEILSIKALSTVAAKRMALQILKSATIKAGLCWNCYNGCNIYGPYD
ncbi:hypothetical protein [Porphyromonas pogonae]|uniref:hypothetical protein n=1 Tax=Porphyromonas pogonae TaxID=867595 RepID=UPI002E792E7F|nr:hypothetical protein [Porphyromonas pogonae]